MPKLPSGTTLGTGQGGPFSLLAFFPAAGRPRTPTLHSHPPKLFSLGQPSAWGPAPARALAAGEEEAEHVGRFRGARETGGTCPSLCGPLSLPPSPAAAGAHPQAGFVSAACTRKDGVFILDGSWVPGSP